MLRVGAACCRANARVLLARSSLPRVLTSAFPSARAFASLPDGVEELVMPALSPTMLSGTVTAWLKQEGEELHAGDVLCQVQTDKAVVDYEMQDDVVLAKILCPAGGDAEVPVGTPLALTTEDVETYASLKASGALDQVQVGAAAATPSAPEPPQASPVSEPEVKPRQPLIKFLGKRSLLPAAEVETRAAAPAAAPAPPAAAPAPAAAASSPAGEDFVDMALSNMRKIIAKRLAASKADVPHHYASIDCEIDDVLAFRKVLKTKHNVKVSLNDFLMRAVAMALRDVPEANCSFDTATQTVKPNASVDISLAVATAAGLITPIVPKVDSLGLAGVNTKLADLIQRARDNKLKPEEFQGGSFTISNLGGFGIDNFTAVINPPQSCILAIGRGRQELVPDESKEVPTPRKATLLNVSMSADRRVVDDVVAGEFLQAFKMYMENPELLTL